MKFVKRQHNIHPDQIYCQNDDGSGNPRYYHIAAMVNWAQNNLPIDYLKPCVKRALFLVNSGAINFEHYENYTRKQDYAPIIVCLEAGPQGGMEIVDGNHRFVRFTELYEQRLAAGEEVGMGAYLFSPKQWQKFVIPLSEVAKLGLVKHNAAYQEHDIHENNVMSLRGKVGNIRSS